MEAQNYSVQFDPFCERHFIRAFVKKYKSAWELTQDNIVEVCRRIDGMLEYQRADLIATSDQFKLIKLDFAIAGTKESPKSSGNRCILVVNENIHSAHIVLVYSKNDISSPNETTKWKMVVKAQYKEYAQILSL